MVSRRRRGSAESTDPRRRKGGDCYATLPAGTAQFKVPSARGSLLVPSLRCSRLQVIRSLTTYSIDTIAQRSFQLAVTAAGILQRSPRRLEGVAQAKAEHNLLR